MDHLFFVVLLFLMCGVLPSGLLGFNGCYWRNSLTSCVDNLVRIKILSCFTKTP